MAAPDLTTVPGIQAEVAVLYSDAEQADSGDTTGINCRIRVLTLAASIAKDAGTDLRLTAIEKALEELRARGQVRRVA
jgi:hypothetical protein